MLRVSDDGPMTGLSTSTGAVVRKPAGKEPAGCGAPRCRRLYGDFDTAVEDAAGDDAAGGPGHSEAPLKGCTQAERWSKL